MLIHAAAGGVGIAALQLARHLGAEVYATASPGKWDALRSWGLDDAHIASSRTLEFEPAFATATDGRGVDVVLDSLAREFVDASLRLLPRGGRFIEMGKTDIRDAAESRPTIRASATMRSTSWTPVRSGSRRCSAILVGLFEKGVLIPLPLATWDVRRAPEAFRFLSQARHIGKIVLTIPQPVDPSGTVLITGGTGALGRRWPATCHRAGRRHLLLVSRRGAEAPDVGERSRSWKAGRGRTGGGVRRRRPSRGRRGLAVRRPAADGSWCTRPGVLDDGMIGSLSPDRMGAVMRPKVDAAWNLHELTEDLDLSMFVLFSSVSGVMGSAGQGNYAAANTFLDALAVYRRGLGLPATSLAWGLWERVSAMTGDLDATDRERIARDGIIALSDELGLALFDAADAAGEALLLAVRLDVARLRDAPPLLRAWSAHRDGAPRQHPAG